MALVSPFVTEKFIAYIGDVLTAELTFAVRLIDEFTSDLPTGGVHVTIEGQRAKPARNLSGYHVITDLPAGTYTVRVESDFYLPAEEIVDTTLLPPKTPVAGITLKPNARYPFPGHATLLRGVVTNGAPVSGALVSVTGKTMTSMTDEQGEFVLFFKGIKTEAITIVIQKGGDTKSTGATIEEGKTVSMGIIHFP